MKKEIQSFGFNAELEARSCLNDTCDYRVGKFRNNIFDNKKTEQFDIDGLICTITSSPTANCQLYTIGMAFNIFKFQNPYDVFCYIQSIVKKNLLMLDINVGYCHNVDDLFKTNIISRIPYTSTNSSSMCIYLINTRNMQKDMMDKLKNDPKFKYCSRSIAEKEHLKSKIEQKEKDLKDSINTIKNKTNVNEIYNDLIEVSDEKN